MPLAALCIIVADCTLPRSPPSLSPYPSPPPYSAVSFVPRSTQLAPSALHHRHRHFISKNMLAHRQHVSLYFTLLLLSSAPAAFARLGVYTIGQISAPAASLMTDFTLEGLCVRAAAWKIKYALKGPDGQPIYTDVAIVHTCVHPSNRGGVYTQGQACKSLFQNTGIDGFSKDEANTPSATCVQERPVSERPENYTTFLKHNIIKCRRDELLDGAYLETDEVSVGNLVHCHLVNVVRAVIRGLRWGHDLFPSDLQIRACDSDGKLSLSALAAHSHFAELATFVNKGFQKCTILHWKMDVEEPSAASAISAAANKGQHIAMKEHEWTALSTLNGLVIPKNGTISEEIVWKLFKNRAQEVLGAEVVKDPLFKHVIRLVHQLGGPGHSYIKELIEFGETMVDSKRRRASFLLYQIACDLPLGHPAAKVALIKCQYSKQPDEDRFIPPPSPLWTKVKEEKMWLLESMLRYIKQDHVTSALAAVSAGEPDQNVADRLARVVLAELNLVVVSAFEGIVFLKDQNKNTATHLKAALVDAAKGVFEKYGVLDKVSGATKTEGAEWIVFDNTAPAATGEAANVPTPKPVGRPKKPKTVSSEVPVDLKGKLVSLPETHDERSLKTVPDHNPNAKQSFWSDEYEKFLYPIPWLDWRYSDLYYQYGLQQSLEVTVATALRLLQEQHDSQTLPVQLRARVDGKARAVVATKDLKKGELLIPISTFKPPRVVPQTSHPHAVLVTVDYKSRRVKKQDSAPAAATAANSNSTAPAGAPANSNSTAPAAATANSNSTAPAGAPASSNSTAPAAASANNLPTAGPAATSASGDTSANVVQPSPSVETSTASPTQTEQAGNTGDPSTGTSTGCNNPPDASNHFAVKKGDVFKMKFGDREWSVHTVLSSGVKMVAPAIGARGQKLKTFQDSTFSFADLAKDFDRVQPTAPAAESQLQQPATVSAPPVVHSPATKAQALYLIQNKLTVETVEKQSNMYILPELALPASVPSVPEKSVDAGGCVPEGPVAPPRWMFTGETALNMFWAVRRLTPSTLASENAALTKNQKPTKAFNCELQKCMVNVTSGATCDNQPLSDTRRCTLYCISNTMNILEGTELLLQIDEPTAPPPVERDCKRLKTSH